MDFVGRFQFQLHQQIARTQTIGIRAVNIHRRCNNQCNYKIDDKQWATWPKPLFHRVHSSIKVQYIYHCVEMVNCWTAIFLQIDYDGLISIKTALIGIELDVRSDSKPGIFFSRFYMHPRALFQCPISPNSHHGCVRRATAIKSETNYFQLESQRTKRFQLLLERVHFCCCCCSAVGIACQFYWHSIDTIISL